ncbi:hypothetical protein [Bermanella sp. R86510]|uniref:hypothetical protein n=1 Tax=unclassified Bermanella TaxID=2627862 RepID=UPI0037CA76CD
MQTIFQSVIVIILFSMGSMLIQAQPQAPVEIKGKLEDIQGQLDSLVERGGRFAYMQLAKKNGLSPFAVAIDDEQNIIMLEVNKKDQGAPVAHKVLKLREMLKLGADNRGFVAGAMFVQARVPHQGKDVDGVAVEMEHIAGLSVLRFSPYEIDRENQNVNFKQPVDKSKPLVFFKDARSKALKNKNNN